MDGERAVDVRAGHVVPVDVDDALALRGQLGEGVGEEIEVVGSAAGTLVDDLAGL